AIVPALEVVFGDLAAVEEAHEGGPLLLPALVAEAAKGDGEALIEMHEHDDDVEKRRSVSVDVDLLRAETELPERLVHRERLFERIGVGIEAAATLAHARVSVPGS